MGVRYGKDKRWAWGSGKTKVLRVIEGKGERLEHNIIMGKRQAVQCKRGKVEKQVCT